MTNLSPVIAANVIVLFAFFVRSFSGFGAALLSIPLLAQFFELKFIVPVECTLEVVLSLILVPKVFRDVHRRDFLFMLGGALVGSLVGIYVLEVVPDQTLKRILGATILLVALNLLLRKGRPHSEISQKWSAFAGLSGGILGGMFGTSGPAYVTYLSYQKREKRQFRATLITLFAIEYSWRFGVFIWNGLYSLEGVKWSCLLAPAVIVATIAGRVAHLQVDERLFRLFVAGLLFVSGTLCFT
jgi:uncharacterized membrane protein YfcA